MPGRNIVKEYVADSFYHIYSRGVNRAPIFHQKKDFEMFLHLLERYLSRKRSKDMSRHLYPNYSGRIQLLCYALMNNHIHMLVYQTDATVITDFMRSLLTSYSIYFNKVQKRVGPVFQSRYKASRITNDQYLDHITRYIHLNPLEWETYEYSSLPFYTGKQQASWISPQPILKLFPDKEQYLQFLRDYEGHKEILDEISWELADQ